MTGYVQLLIFFANDREGMAVAVESSRDPPIFDTSAVDELKVSESAAAEHVKKGEDKWCIVEYSETSSFYGLFDGHGGARFATALAKTMPKRLKDAKTEVDIVEAYYAVDAELGPKYATEGATAACAQVDRTSETSARVVLTWVGDSRLVAVDMGSKALVWQSSMHHVSNDDEIVRVNLHWKLREKEAAFQKMKDPIAFLVDDAIQNKKMTRATSSRNVRGSPITSSPRPAALKKRSKTDGDIPSHHSADEIKRDDEPTPAKKKTVVVAATPGDPVPPERRDSTEDTDEEPSVTVVFEGVRESGSFRRRRDRAKDLVDFLHRGKAYAAALALSDDEHGVPLKRAPSFVGRRSNSEGRPVGPHVLQSVWQGAETVLGASTCVTRSMGDWDSSRCLLPHPDVAIDNVHLGTDIAVWKRYVLASDGLWDVVTPHQVAKIIANEATCALAADALIAAAQKRYLKMIDKSKPSGTDPFKDDTTVVVFDVRLGDQDAIPRPTPKAPGSFHRSPSKRRGRPILC